MARGVIKLAALAGLAKQARDYARNNPESVSSAIGKVESAVGRKVGPKYAGHVGKGGSALRAGLGISSARPVGGTTPAPHGGATTPRTDGTTPRTDGTTPRTDGTTPRTDGTTPRTDGTTPPPPPPV